MERINSQKFITLSASVRLNAPSANNRRIVPNRLETDGIVEREKE